MDCIAELDLRNCDEHMRLQVSLIDINNIDYLGRMSNFENDLKEVGRLIGMPIENVVKKNQTKKDALALTDSQITRIKKLYKVDYQVFYANQLH